MELNILYGIDGERVKCEWTDSTGSVYKKRLYFGEYEITETGSVKEDVCYISSPDGLTAVMMHHGDTYKIYYLCTDHLGSITLLMNDAGNLIGLGAIRDEVLYKLTNSFHERNASEYAAKYYSEEFIHECTSCEEMRIGYVYYGCKMPVQIQTAKKHNRRKRGMPHRQISVNSTY